jgi:hypothetical protein
MNKRIAFMMLFGLGGIGCSRANVMGLRRDLAEISSRFSVDLKGPQCKMVGHTRTGYCISPISNEGVASLISGLNLSRLNGKADEINASDIGSLDFDNGCRKEGPFTDISKMEIHGIHNRPDSLRMKDGSAFQYLLLFHNQTTGEVCIQVSYSYG